MFLSPPYSLGIEAATTIAQLACYKGVLPQGAPSSPVITNMICRPLDNQMMRFCKKYGVKYTRYADDLTFSTYLEAFPDEICNNIQNNIKIGNSLKSLIRKNGFEINEDKVFLNSNRTRQEVTGLIVNQFPNIKRRYIKELRAILHECENNGVYNAALHYIAKGLCKNQTIISKASNPESEKFICNWFKAVLKGKVNFIKQVKGEDSLTYLNFASKVNSVFEDSVFDLTSLGSFNDKILNTVFVLWDTSTERQGSGFLIKDIGLITNYHVTDNDGFYKVYKYNDYPDDYIKIISKSINELKSNKEIDYALYDFDSSHSNCFELGDSTRLQIGQNITIIGYPNFISGNSPYIQTCPITSRKNYFGTLFYTIGGRVSHGASGGIVLDEKQKIIGIIKGGIVSLEDDDTNENQGFIPIHLFLNDMIETIDSESQ